MRPDDVGRLAVLGRISDGLGGGVGVRIFSNEVVGDGS